MAIGVATIWFPVDDMQRAVSFYADTLGLELSDQQEQWAELKADGLTIGLNARGEESTSGDGGGVIAFSPSGSLEDAVEELGGKGVEFTDGISEHPWGRIAAFRDPEGNALQLYEPPK